MIVDNVAFGLARTRGQARRAERSSAGLEHHRNDDAGAAAKVVEETCSSALALIERVDVDPSTSNQWSLVYRRVEGGAA